MAFSKIQEVHDFSSFTALGLTFSSNVTVGNLIIVQMLFGQITSTVSVSDNLGNTWIPIETQIVDSGNAGKVAAFYAIANSTGSCTFTFAHASGPALVNTLPQGVEFHNTSSPITLETSATLLSSSNSTSPHCPITVTGAADLIVAVCAPRSGTTIHPDTGWLQASATLTDFSLIYGIETSSGLFTPQYVMSISGGWGVIAAAFALQASSKGNSLMLRGSGQ